MEDEVKAAGGEAAVPAAAAGTEVQAASANKPIPKNLTAMKLLSVTKSSGGSGGCGGNGSSGGFGQQADS